MEIKQTGFGKLSVT